MQLNVETSKILAFWLDYIRRAHDEDLRRIVAGFPEDGTILEVKFSDIETIAPDEAGSVLSNPRPWIQLANMAVQQIMREDLYQTVVPLDSLKVEIVGLPETTSIAIADIRSKDRGLLLTVHGQVRSVKPRQEVLVVGVFECVVCAGTARIPQDGQTVVQPKNCQTCRGYLKLDPLRSKYANIQEVLLQEDFDLLDNGASPKNLTVRLAEEQIDELVPGDRCTLSGIYTGEHQKKDLTIKTWLDVTHIRKKGAEMMAFKATPEFIAKAKAFSQGNPLGDILQTVSGDIYGRLFERTAILLCIVGGVRRKHRNGSIRRGDSHILLLGDPGVAKTKMMRLLARVAPRAVFASGGSSSKAGLLAAVVKDEFSKNGGFTLEAGAMVLANRGNLFFDEFDKTNKDDRAAAHEALESQTVTVAKAGINATLTCQCGVIAAANPKGGKFDPDEPLLDQFDIPPTLVTRFDLIIPIVDRKNKEADAALADHMASQELPEEGEAAPQPHDLTFLKHYVAYVKRLEPKLSKEAIQLCTDYFKTIRAAADNVTARQMEALYRMSEAHAKIHMKEVVDAKSAEFAITMHKQYSRLVGLDPLTGELDFGAVSGLGHTMSQDERIKIIVNVVKDLSKSGPGYATTIDVVKRLKELGVKEEISVKTIDNMVKGSHHLYSKGGYGTLAALG